MVDFLYIDEAGCPGALTKPQVQPIFCLAGLIIPAKSDVAVTQEFLNLKREFNPNIARDLKHDLDIMRHEIKGSELKKKTVHTSRNVRRQSIGFLDKSLRILENHQCRLFARCDIKHPDKAFDGVAIYTSAVQKICQSFNDYLKNLGHLDGVVIADSRRRSQNTGVHHSIFTQKHKKTGDEYPRIIQPPLFGHNENHVGLQMADILASAILIPTLIHVYCLNEIKNDHVRSYEEIVSLFAQRIKKLQYRYKIDDCRYGGGITVRDNLLESRSAKLIFEK